MQLFWKIWSDNVNWKDHGNNSTKKWKLNRPSVLSSLLLQLASFFTKPIKWVVQNCATTSTDLHLAPANLYSPLYWSPIPSNNSNKYIHSSPTYFQLSPITHQPRVKTFSLICNNPQSPLLTLHLHISLTSNHLHHPLLNSNNRQQYSPR